MDKGQINLHIIQLLFYHVHVQNPRCFSVFCVFVVVVA